MSVKFVISVDACVENGLYISKEECIILTDKVCLENHSQEGYITIKYSGKEMTLPLETIGKFFDKLLNIKLGLENYNEKEGEVQCP
jgi:hypothetical protein